MYARAASVCISRLYKAVGTCNQEEKDQGYLYRGGRTLRRRGLVQSVTTKQKCSAPFQVQQHCSMSCFDLIWPLNISRCHWLRALLFHIRFWNANVSQR